MKFDLLLRPRPQNRETEGAAAQRAGQDCAMEKAHHHSTLLLQGTFVWATEAGSRV